MVDVRTLRTVMTPVSPVDEAVIAALEDLLAMAKRGEVQGIAYATINSDGLGAVLSTGTGYKGEGILQNAHAAIGVVEVLKGRLLQSIDP
jgi:hypothetical protein